MSQRFFLGHTLQRYFRLPEILPGFTLPQAKQLEALWDETQWDCRPWKSPWAASQGCLVLPRLSACAVSEPELETQRTHLWAFVLSGLSPCWFFFFFSFFFSHLHEIGLAEFASTTRFRHLWKDPCCWRCLHLLPRLNLPPLSGCSWSRPRFSPPSQNSVVPQRHPKMVSVLSNWFTHLFPESSSSFLQRVLSMSLSTLKQRQRLTLSVRAFSFSFSGFWNQAESPRTLDLDIVCLAFSPSSTSVSTLAFWGFPRGLTATPRKRRKFPQSAWRSFTSFCFFWTSVRELCLKPSRIWFTGILGLKYSWGFSVEPAFYHRSDIYLFVCLGAPSQQSVYLYMQLLDIFKPENRTIDSLSKTGLRTFICFCSNCIANSSPAFLPF